MQSSYPNKVPSPTNHQPPHALLPLVLVSKALACRPCIRLLASRLTPPPREQDPQELRAFLARFGVVGTLSTQVTHRASANVPVRTVLTVHISRFSRLRRPRVDDLVLHPTVTVCAADLQLEWRAEEQSCLCAHVLQVKWHVTCDLRRVTCDV